MGHPIFSLRVLVFGFCWWVQCGSGRAVDAPADGKEMRGCRIKEQASPLRHSAGRARLRVFDFRDNIVLKCGGACRRSSGSSNSKGPSASGATASKCHVQWTLERLDAHKERDRKPQPLANVLRSNRFCIAKRRLQLSGKFLAKNSGTLRCLVDGTEVKSWNTTRGRTSRSVFVQERARPIFTKLPQSMSVVGRGATLRLACAAGGYPRPHVAWLRGYTTIESAAHSNRVYVTSNGTLVITSVRPSDENTYRCVAENQLDLISWRSLVYVI